MSRRYDADNLDPNYCIARVCPPPNWASWQCENARTYGDYCGIHSPSKQAARRAKRGPTQFERECAAISKRAQNERALEAVLIAARRVTEAVFKLGAVSLEASEAFENLNNHIKHYDKVTDGS